MDKTVSIYVFRTVEDRDSGDMRKGKHIADVTTEEEFETALKIMPPHGYGYWGYYDGDHHLGDYNSALRAVGGTPLRRERFPSGPRDYED